MKNYIFGLLAGTAVAFTASFAIAADMPTKSPYSPVPVTNWSGFYVGANAGGGFDNFTAAGGGGTLNANATGFVGGGQIGANWQMQQLVLGIEGDFQGTSQKATNTVDGGSGSASMSLPWFGTVRGRVGYAWDNMLLYGTAGVAFSNLDLNGLQSGLPVSGNNTATGFVGGGGVEWMFAPRWSAKLEYLYLNTGYVPLIFTGAPIFGKSQDNIVRVGLNYHF